MATENSTWKQTVSFIRDEIRRYSQNSSSLAVQAVKNLYSHPSFAAVFLYRIGHWAWCSHGKLIPGIVYVLFRFAYPLIRWYSGVEIQPRTKIGSGLCILHFGPTIIHPNVIAGSNLTLMPGVTIGEAGNGTPILGDNVAIGSSAIVIGAITIGDNVNIGAGAVVTRNLPANCTAVGVPAKPLPRPE